MFIRNKRLDNVLHALDDIAVTLVVFFVIVVIVDVDVSAAAVRLAVAVQAVVARYDTKNDILVAVDFDIESLSKIFCEILFSDIYFTS